jgi:hypothetical protein
MPDTGVELRSDQVARKATGHSRRGRDVPDLHLGAMPGALYSPVPDLLTLLRCRLRPDCTALPDALRLVQRPQVRRNRWLQVGLGWFISPVRSTGHTAVWHDGGTGGFASCVALLPALGASIVVLADTARSVDRIGVRLLASLAESASSSHDRSHGSCMRSAARSMSPVPALLQIAGLVDDQDPVGTEVLDDEVAQLAGDRVGVPGGAGEQMLHAPGAGLAGLLGQRPAVARPSRPSSASTIAPSRVRDSGRTTCRPARPSSSST